VIWLLPIPTSELFRTMIPTPSRIRRKPSVTMNDGIRRRATSVPWIAPTPADRSNAARIAAHQGHPGLGCTNCATTTAETPMTRPTERSISARRRTKISPMARTM
jgi:hypothetical protein